MLTTAKKEEKAEEPGEVIEQKHEPALETFLDVEPLSLEIGYGLIPLVEEPEGQLLGKIKAMRRQLAQEIGFIVPPIHIKDNLQLRPHEYSFLVKGMEIGKAETMVSKWLAVSSRAGASKLDGVPTTEPTFGLPAYWIDEKGIEKAQISGYTVVDPATVIATHLTEMIRRNGWELLTRTEVQKLLDNISKNYPKIVEELVPNTLPLGTVQRVLQGLLKERIPIRDIVTVLETLLDYGSQIKDPEILIEHARHALARTITKQFLVQGNTLPVFTLDPRFEKHFIQAAENGENIPPDVINRLIRGIEKVIGSESAKGIQPVIVCSSSIRRYFRRLIERFIPSLVVISNNEIAPSVKLYTMGMVSYEN
jgi:flagellar biosynthesis protein FlhA